MTEQNTGWRDISTAPKDTDFLAIIRSDSGRTTMCVGCFLEDGFYVAGDDLSNAWTPTHWQPLPPPPGEDAAEHRNQVIQELVEKADAESAHVTMNTQEGRNALAASLWLRDQMDG